MTNSEPPGCSPGVPIEVATTIDASTDNSIDVLEQTFVSVVRVLTTEGTDRGDDNTYEHVAAEFELEDYAKELFPQIWSFLLNLNFPKLYLLTIYFEPKINNYFDFIFSSFIYIFIIFFIFILFLFFNNVLQIKIIIKILSIFIKVKGVAFLPDLTEPAETKLDYTANNVRNPELSAEQQASLIAVLKNHDKIMIASGNALPPPAYDVVCDIDVGGHAPIKQRARRISLRQLKKLYELLKGLLQAGLIAFSDNPWASPIVIVLKKNGLDIRLCIDYKLVNAVTMIMEYAMPLVDDLLTDLEVYLWFCSLDAASGFWAIMMTMRARKISAFVCPLGHFEWLRMPFGLKNAPMIYQRMIDNALWGFVQPKGGWRVLADRMQAAEERADKSRQRRNEESMHWSANPQNVRTKFDGAHEDSVTADPV
ncbi:unnamed protein product [Phytophthora fragariaefolia]|uniref:Unnamed protein product n=1 Tax=Phytophthora fragariaefolia TaxID=1490495 RepID=A0A9W6UFJ8_9STRA|nr:unnamed protein product [Phytophthora fragariaefolia]